MDSDNTCLESEADIEVRADPIVEVSILNSEAAAHDCNNATLANITTQIQDLLTTVMTAIKAERSIKKGRIPGRNDKIDRNHKGAV